MHNHRFAIALIAAGALAVANSGTGQADSAKPPRPLGFSVQQRDRDVVTTIDSGRFDIDRARAQVELRDAAGAVVETWPLAYRYHGMDYPIGGRVSGDSRTVTLTPVTDAAQARPTAGTQAPTATSTAGTRLRPVASPLEDARAQANFMNQLSIATSVGSIVGTIIGGVLGGIAGAVVALASCVALLACLVAGLPVFITFASAGAILGTIVAGGGALVSAGWDYVQTLYARPNTTHWR